ncbi:hypothetical protein EDB82DRAFT_473841 [Fusarium venenatum]|uniref:uncharacterized protein n=1 Tax=Fusarium venenatum TaxID=56646 RepID=UPI001D66A9FC|nr:hypothetical protein EDB82DRAFT_473841 [Fusarium venenatum]
MAQAACTDQLILAQLPALPWPSDGVSSTRGCMPDFLLVNGRLPSFKDEPGYMFYRGAKTAIVFFIKNSRVIPNVLPFSILKVGVQFRTLAEQTADQNHVRTQARYLGRQLSPYGQTFRCTSHSRPNKWASRAENRFPATACACCQSRSRMRHVQVHWVSRQVLSYAPKPLSESLFQPADDEEGEEGEVDDEMDDAMEENDDE